VHDEWKIYTTTKEKYQEKSNVVDVQHPVGNKSVKKLIVNSEL